MRFECTIQADCQSNLVEKSFHPLPRRDKLRRALEISRKAGLLDNVLGRRDNAKRLRWFAGTMAKISSLRARFGTL